MLSFAGHNGDTETIEFPAPLQTELVEIPVIIVDQEVQLISPEFKKLSIEVLSDMAVAMGGVVGYLKVRAYYQHTETQHCTYKGCWRPAASSTEHRCDSHPLAATK